MTNILTFDYDQSYNPSMPVSVGTAVMSGIWGERRRVNTYLVTIQVGNRLIRGVRVAGVATDMDAILGRNILNELMLVLNGPATAVELPISRDES